MGGAFFREIGSSSYVFPFHGNVWLGACGVVWALVLFTESGFILGEVAVETTLGEGIDVACCFLGLFESSFLGPRGSSSMFIGDVIPTVDPGRGDCWDFISCCCRERSLIMSMMLPICEEMDEESMSSCCLSLLSMSFDKVSICSSIF